MEQNSICKDIDTYFRTIRKAEDKARSVIIASMSQMADIELALLRAEFGMTSKPFDFGFGANYKREFERIMNTASSTLKKAQHDFERTFRDEHSCQQSESKFTHPRQSLIALRNAEINAMLLKLGYNGPPFVSKDELDSQFRVIRKGMRVLNEMPESSQSYYCTQLQSLIGSQGVITRKKVVPLLFKLIYRHFKESVVDNLPVPVSETEVSAHNLRLHGQIPLIRATIVAFHAIARNVVFDYFRMSGIDKEEQWLSNNQVACNSFYNRCYTTLQDVMQAIRTIVQKSIISTGTPYPVYTNDEYFDNKGAIDYGRMRNLLDYGLSSLGMADDVSREKLLPFSVFGIDSRAKLYDQIKKLEFHLRTKIDKMKKRTDEKRSTEEMINAIFLIMMRQIECAVSNFYFWN